MTEKKVATEVAEMEFTRFAAAMDLDLDPKGMDDEDKKSFERLKGIVIRAIENGHVEINSDDEPVVHPRTIEDTTPITFFEPEGAAFMEMDKKRKDHDVAKQMALLAAITKQNAGKFSKMKQRDLKVLNAILMLFLG
jgi:hypothetical protein